MSAYGEFKKRDVVYCTYLFAGERGVVDFDETRIYLNALQTFDIMEKEAFEDVFGEGDYRVSLIKEFFDDKGRFVKGECLKDHRVSLIKEFFDEKGRFVKGESIKKVKIKQGDAR